MKVPKRWRRNKNNCVGFGLDSGLTLGESITPPIKQPSPKPQINPENEPIKKQTEADCITCRIRREHQEAEENQTGSTVSSSVAELSNKKGGEK